MLAYIKGEVIRQISGGIVVLANNIGYKIFTNKSHSVGENIGLHIYQYIREDQNTLYGFSKLEELAIFEQLITVSGVGPKLAIQILSHIDAPAIVKAIEEGNTTIFRSISGVGTKVATKIIIDLKTKISLENTDLSKITSEDPLIDGLMGLGISKGDAIATIVRIPKELTQTKDRLQWSLKNLI